jgi:SAM-dependent methyltransferase
MLSPNPFATRGRIRAASYRVLWSCSTIFHKAANACLSTAAGLVRRDELRAASQVRWRHVGSLLDDSEIGLDLWERRLYVDLLHPSERVLLVGSGAGRDLLALADLGFDVTGIEPVPELVDLTRSHLARRGTRGTVLGGFVETLDLHANYDVVLFPFDVYALIPGSASRIATLARLAQHLSPKGRIVIICAGPTDRVPSAIWLTRLSAWLARTDWVPERGDRLTRDHFGERTVKYEHLFGRGELTRECEAAGLRIVQDENITSPFRLQCVVVSPAVFSSQ